MHAHWLALVTIALAADAAGEGEQRLPGFDLEKAQASYVVSLPAGYDAAKSWPLVLDFHGAISPRLKGASVTQRRLWSKFTKENPSIVVGLNGRTRAWNMTKGEKDDRAYALAVLAETRKKYSIDSGRIYLAGFSSGADYLCSGGLQREGLFAGSLVVCPGPPNVVGLKNGALLKSKDRAFYIATGEEDYIRKDGAWQAFLALDKAGGRAMYREVPGVGHTFFSVEEYARLLNYLEELAAKGARFDDMAIARKAVARNDYYDELTERLRDLAKRFPQRAKLLSMGKSLEGRDLWVLEITDLSAASPDPRRRPSPKRGPSSIL